MPCASVFSGKKGLSSTKRFGRQIPRFLRRRSLSFWHLVKNKLDAKKAVSKTMWLVEPSFLKEKFGWDGYESSQDMILSMMCCDYDLNMAEMI